MEEFDDIVILGSGHSLITAPKQMGVPVDIKAFKNAEEHRLKAVNKRTNLVSMGLFETSSPNYTNYYPEVKAEDLNPSDADFVFPVFRLLSKTIVHPTWNPIDFGKGSVLKDSIPLLIGQSIYVDHETAVGNAIGSVSKAWWQNAYTTAEGLKVPGGIVGELKIDGKSNPRLARGIMMDPPSIHSNSVTVAFTWEKSHDLSDNEFWEKLGTLDKDGKMIRRVVNKVKAYYETSLVSHGADSFAKKLDEAGKIILPTHVNAITSFSDHPKNKPFYFLNFKDVEDVVQNSSTTPKKQIQANNTIQNQSNMKKELVELAKMLGLEFDGENISSLAQEIQEKLIKPLQGEVTKFKDSEKALNDTITKLKGEKEDLETQLKGEKEKPLKTIREAIISNISKIYLGEENKDKVTKLTNMVNNLTDETSLHVLATQYEEELENKFPMTCQNCHSTEISRNSASKKGEEGDKGKKEVKLSREDKKNFFKKKNKQ